MITYSNYFTLPDNVEDMILGYNEYLEQYAGSGYGNDLDNVMTGNAGDNHLLSGSGHDTLIGGRGGDIVEGQTGNDIYLYYRGDGNDLILEDGVYDANSGNDTADTLYFADLYSYEVTSARSGNDLIFTVISDGSQIRLDHFYSHPTMRIDFVKFADGTVIDISPNNAPTAPVIANQTATEESLFTFAVPAFSDPDPGDVLTYSASGYPSWLTFNAATRTFSGTPTNDSQAGQSTITVTATDQAGAIASANFVLTVNAVNDAPVRVTEIPDQTTDEGNMFSYQIPLGTFTDEENGGSLTYSATGMPSGISFDSSTRTFSGTPAVYGTSTITVTATDSGGLSVQDTFVLTVNDVNDAPVRVTEIPDQTTTENAWYSYQIPLGTFTDKEDGNSLTYSATGMPTGISFDSSTLTFSGTPTVGRPVTITVTATDSGGKSATDTFVLSVTNVNDAPWLVHSIPDQTATEDTAFSYQIPWGTFFDEEDRYGLTYSASGMPSWLKFDSATQTFSGTPTNDSQAVQSTITVTAADSAGAYKATNFTLNVSPVNDAPVLVTQIPNQTATESAAFSYQIPAGTFTDEEDGTSLTYSATGMPQGITFDPATRTFSGKPIAAGSKSVTVTATDSDGATTTDKFTIHVNSTNTPPVLANEIPDQTATENTEFSYQIPANTFYDREDRNLSTYTATGMPPGIHFDSVTRTFSGTPTAGGKATITVTATDSGGLSVSDSFILTVIDSFNDAPVRVTPIPDQTATEDSLFSYTIPAGTFTDEEDATLNYSIATALPSWLTFDAATRTFSGMPTKNSQAGQSSITVTATDSGGKAVTDSFLLTVTAVNDAPVLATPILDQTVTEDTPFSFTIPAGTFSDEEDTSLTYSASGMPAGITFDASTRTFGGISTIGGESAITVTATDSGGKTATDTFVLAVNEVNDAPVLVNPIPEQWATQGVPFSYQIPLGTFTDEEDGDYLTYSASNIPEGISFDPATRTFSGTPTRAFGSDEPMETTKVTVTDSGGLSKSTIFSFYVEYPPVNTPPYVLYPIPDKTVRENVYFWFRVGGATFGDKEDGNDLTYSVDESSLPAGVTFDAATRTFRGTPTIGGESTIIVTATDSGGLSASDSFVLTVTNVNDIPVLVNPIPDQTTAEGTDFSYQIPLGTFTDEEDGNDLTYYVDTVPEGIVFDSATRTFSGTPITGGSTWITVTAMDTGGMYATDTFEFTVTDTSNDAPELVTPIPDQTATENESFSYTIPADTFHDEEDGYNLTYSAGALPAGIVFDAATRTFSGIPSVGGDSSITVTVTDTGGKTASDTFILKVANVNDAPVVAHSIADQTATEDSDFSFTIPKGTFTDEDDSTLIYSASGMPSWLVFDAATQTFSGKPTNDSQAGQSKITVTARDAAGAQVNADFNLTVNAVNDAPVLVTAIPDQTATENTAFSYQIPLGTFTDEEDGTNLTYSVGSLPVGITFDATTRTFSGTPTVDGATSITVTATDSGGKTAQDTFVLTVTDTFNDAPVLVTAIPDQTATENTAFSYQIPLGTFTDEEDGTNLSYSVDILPAGIAFNAATRTFSGTPTVDGATSIIVTAKDSGGKTATDTFILTVTDTFNDAPVLVTAIPDQSATENTAFSYQVPLGTFTDEEDGTNLTYSVGSLPAGITFDAATRTFSGTPTIDGATSITVTAKDSGGKTATDTFVITVTDSFNDAPVLVTAIPDQTATENTAFSYQIPLGTFTDEEDGNNLSYSVGSLPVGITFDAATRTFSGTPTVDGATSITVTAKDSGGKTATDTFILTVTDTFNDAPVLVTAIPDQSATENTAFSYQIPLGTFTDEEDGNNLTYSVGTLPVGIAFDPVTRTFSGTPTVDGATSITVTATDSGGKTATDTFIFTVSNSFNDAPVLVTPIADQSAAEDSPFSFTIPAGTFTDEEDGNNLSYSVDTLPAGITFNAATRTFSGTPTVDGATSITVTATDTGGKTAQDTFVITVTDTFNDAPVLVTAIPDQTATENTAFSYQIPLGTFTDEEDGTNLTYSVGSLPTGITFDAATRTFSGTPTVDGATSITVTAKDSGGKTATDTFIFTVTDSFNDAPVLVTAIPDQTAPSRTPWVLTLKI